MSDKYDELTDREQIYNKPGMFMGPISIKAYDEYIINDDIITLEKVVFSQGWYKILDEVIVNACDQFQQYPGKVDIYVTFDNNGMISVKNTGPGFEVYLKTTSDGKQVYTPEFCLTRTKAGSNVIKESSKGNETTGGINGYGVKLTNIFSKKFTIITVDGRPRKEVFYAQVMKDNMIIIGKPTIIPKQWSNWNEDYDNDLFKKGKNWTDLTPEQKMPHTTIKYLPDYVKFGYDDDDYYLDDELDTLSKLIKTRLYFTAAYLGKHGKVYFNNQQLHCQSISILAKMMICTFDGKSRPIKSCTIENDLPWKVTIGNSNGQAQSISIVNGIIVKKGDHIKHIESLIVLHLKPRVELMTREYKPASITINNLIRDSLFILIICNIPNVEWDAQSKKELTVSKSLTNQYTLSDAYIESVWPLLKKSIEDKFLIGAAKKSHKRPKVNLKNYYPAHKCGIQSDKCSLYVVEGNSAMGTAKSGLDSEQTNIDSDYFGIVSLKGVPLNVRKEISTRVDKDTNQAVIHHHDKFKNNTIWTGFIQLTGLGFEKKYEYFTLEECNKDESKKQRTVQGDKEFKTLKYGRIIGLVDQDEDGKGQIWGLFMNCIALFWPYLFKRKWIFRQNTPITRVYDKNENLIKTFYNTNESDQWLEKFNVSTNIIKYYKGLGSHTNEETDEMMKNYDSHMECMMYDDHAENIFEIYFGKNTNLRKEELSICSSLEQKLDFDDYIKIDKAQPTFKATLSKCSNVLRTDTKSFQLHNILRHTPHAIDGMLPVRRKIICASFVKFGQSNVEIEIYKLSGNVAENMAYHHGDSSLGLAITHMAQHFTGGRILPLLLPRGNFGSRSLGGTDAASVRYIKTKLNIKLVKSAIIDEDKWILPYNFDGNTRIEPVFFVPIIPLSILEDQQTMGSGWGSNVYARDVFEIIKSIEERIVHLQDYGKDKSRNKITNVTEDITASTHGYKYNSVRHIDINDNMSEYSYGHYELNGNKLIIKELPRKIWNHSYIHGSDINPCPDCKVNKRCDVCQYKIDNNIGIEHKKFVKKVIDKSTNKGINIIIELEPGAIKTISTWFYKKINKASINFNKKLSRINKKMQKNEDELAQLLSDEPYVQGDDVDVDSTPAEDIEIKCEITEDIQYNAIIHYFNLRKSMKRNLNFIVNGLGIKKNGSNQYLKSYNSYMHVFDHWFSVRKNYYIKRICRAIIISKLKIIMYKNIIKFIRLRNKYSLSDILKDDQIKIIDDTKEYTRIDRNILDNPKYIKARFIKEHVLKKNAGYMYLLKLNSLQMNKAGLKLYIDKLQEEENLLTIFQTDNKGFIGSDAWLSELSTLKEIITVGLNNNWSTRKR